jgi:hypothetical protein
MTDNNQNQDEFNPDNFAPIPANLLSQDEELDYLIDASPEEMQMVYAQEEEVVDTTTKFLNIEGAEYGQQIFNALKEGHLDPIRTLLMLKKMAHVHDFFLSSTAGRMNKKAKDYIREQVTNIVGKETYQAYGASIAIQSIGGAGSTDYKECGDLLLNRLYELQNQIKEMVKERELYIKTELPAESRTLGVRSIKETYMSLPVIREEELWEPVSVNVNPPIKYSKEGIVVRFARKKK